MEVKSPARRARVRPMPIAEFCDRVLSTYKLTPSRGNHGTLSVVRRVTTFLIRHPSVKTTSDLTSSLIPEFAGILTGYSHSYRLAMLMQFRRVCILAIEWEYLERNPFEGYQFPHRAPQARSRRGPDLDFDHARRILEYLKSRSDAWEVHRLYALTAVMIYAGLQRAEALMLRSADLDFDGRSIRIPSRTKFANSFARLRRPEKVEMVPALAEILTEWIQVRRDRRPIGSNRGRYGMRPSDDRSALIPDHRERRVMADMLRWRREGWNFCRIARELNSLKIPTRKGASGWSNATVRRLLIRELRPGSGGDLQASDPGWIFPNIRGDGFWGRSSSPGHSPLDQIRDTGTAVGIAGLTFSSLRRFYVENARTVMDLGMRRSPEAASADVATLSRAGCRSRVEPRPVPTWPPGRCPASLGADGSVSVVGTIKILTYPQFKVIKSLIDAGPSGLTGDELIERSGRVGYRNILRTLARDEDWASRIRMAGNRHEHYRLAMPHDK